MQNICKLILVEVMSEQEEKTKILEKYKFLFSFSEGFPENYDNELFKIYNKILKPAQ